MPVSKQLLSGSTSGRPIAVAATATPGTIIHTATSATGALDEIYLYANNVSTSDVALTIEFGGTTTADQSLSATTIPARANSFPIPVVPGICLGGGLIVRAFAGTTNVINITGFVNRITP
jgi:hypothetical protein